MTFLRMPQVLAKTGLGRTTLLDGVRAGEWPPPVRLARRCVAWLEREVDEVLAVRVAGADDDAVRRRVAELIAARKQGAPVTPTDPPPAAGARHRGAVANTAVRP